MKREMDKRINRKTVLDDAAYKAVYTSNADAIVLVDVETKQFVEVNDAALQMFGYTRDEMLDLTVLDISDEKQETERAVERAGQEKYDEQPAYFRYCVKKDGTVFPVEINVNIIQIDGRSTLIGAMRDLSSRFNQETALRQWADIFRYSNWGIVVQDPVSEKMILMNRAFAEMHGSSVAELQGLPFIDLFVSEKRDETVTLFENCKDEQYFSFTSEHRHANGQNFPVQIDVQQLRNENMVQSQRIMHVHDISLQRSASLELERQREFISLISEHSTNFIFVKDYEGRFLFMNEAMAKSFGMTREEATNKLNSELHQNPVEVEGYLQDDRRVLDHNEPVVVDETQTMLDGTVRHFQTIKSPLRIDEKTTHILGIAIDVTESKLATDLMQRVSRARAIVDAQENERRRISKELHDGLGQMLTAVQLSIENCRARIEPVDEKTRDILKSVENHIQNAIAEGGRISHNLMPRLLDDFGIGPALDLLCEQIRKAHDINLSFYAHGLKKRLDQKLELALYRIAQEALNNMLKHAEATEASVQLVLHEESVNMVIEDDGRGFDVTVVNKQENSPGSMGLLNMRERAEALNGLLVVDSTEGRGTEIMVELPLTQEAGNGLN